MRKGILVSFLMLLTTLFASAEEYPVHINWLNVVHYDLGNEMYMNVMSFENSASHPDFGLLPVYYQSIKNMHLEPGSTVQAQLINAIYEPVPEQELDAEGLKDVPSELVLLSGVMSQSHQRYPYFYIVPFRKNIYTNSYERLVSADVEVILVENKTTEEYKELSFVDNSVLATGNWYKIYVESDGMYQLTSTDLESLGIPVSSIDPVTLKIFGNGGGMVPENNSTPRLDDLNEIAITVTGQNDGSFDSQDKILFYGQSPNRWYYDANADLFEKQENYYSERTCYFVTYGGEPGKRIQHLEQSVMAPTNTVTTYNYYLNHELDAVNLIGSGREWYGEVFDVQLNYSFDFSIPDVDKNSNVNVYADMAARATSSSSFSIKINNQSYVVGISKINLSYGSVYAISGELSKTFKPESSDMNVDITYNKSTSSATGWLNKIQINGRRALKYTGGTMRFCDTQSYGIDEVSLFKMSSASSSVTILDVTDHQNVKIIDATLAGNELSFVANTDTLREFLAYDGNYSSPIIAGKIANQNLHAQQPVNMVILTHPDFFDEAVRLAEYHNNEGISTRVVNIYNVYNEFSSGVQDIGGLRDYVRMLYSKRSGVDMGLKYLLLYGDGSYDYKNRVSGNNNFVPTWQSTNSLDATNSYATDDFFGCLDPEEGLFRKDVLDIGIGRLSVSNTEESQMALNKILHYSSNASEVMGDWRNMITLVADDEDSGLHVFDADKLAKLLDNTALSYNVDKIYSDSYTQVVASGGARYPAVNEAINTKMAKGSLIMNYVGHGGEVGWALERILELSDINSWTNYDMLSVFITATCEFTRFDDPKRVSAGEQVFLNPDGGAVALFTTTRATFATSNYTLNRAIYLNAFTTTKGQYPSLGDLLKIAKEAAGSGMNAQKFVLIGDPAMKLAYPVLKVETTEFNGQPHSDENDTIRALEYVTIAGQVTNRTGTLAEDFTGVVYPTVYDKPSVISTLGNDPKSPIIDFELRNRILYKGKADVINGKFTFSFHVPKDINYSYGFGKISYYVDNAIIDGAGYDTSFIIGGYSNQTQTDETGPQINLFINDPFFTNGGLTNSDPIIYAEIFDESGINVGTGIGHDLTAIIDGNSDKIYVLNDFYEGDLNTYKSGTVAYPLFNLTPGKHTMELKVWDALNNSSIATVTFYVAAENEIILDNFHSYPNPFTHETTLFFEHNQAGQELQMDYYIFDLSGKLVKFVEKSEIVAGYRTTNFTWNGTDNYGNPLPGGIYVCKLIVTNEENNSNLINSKFVLVR